MIKDYLLKGKQDRRDCLQKVWSGIIGVEVLLTNYLIAFDACQTMNIDLMFI